MPPSKNHTEADLNEIAHEIRQHLERIDYHVSADDQSAAWHEVEKLKAYLEWRIVSATS